MAEEQNKDLQNEENKIIEGGVETETTKEPENVNVAKDEPKVEQNVEIDSSKFEDKVEAQVNRIFKDLETLAFHGSKSKLSDDVVEAILTEIREQSNIAKKQFSSNQSVKDFDDVSTHVNKVLKEFKVLGELSNKHSGEYTEEHTDMIFEGLRKKINETKKGLKFKDKKDKKFKF